MRRWCSAAGVLVTLSARRAAAEVASGAATFAGAQADLSRSRETPAPARREVVLALGYGSLVVPRGIVVSRTTDSAERVAAIDGLSVDITRRLPQLELGARFWRMGGASDGKGAHAHVLTRWTTEARFYPWQFRTVEPWVGAELGLVLADDFALWDATGTQPARRAVAGVRPGLVAGLEAGARLHLGPLLALGLRGGILYLGFDRTGGKVADSPEAPKYFVQPTDYGRRLWLSMGIVAELTVPD
jgi:hypothetical protein